MLSRFLIPYYFDSAVTRFFFLITTVPGMLFLRASCFTRRLCLATPFEGRLALVLTVVVSNCIAPLGTASVFRFVFRPEFANFFPGFLTGMPIFDLKHGDELIELHFRFIHFDQIILNHETPLGVDMASDLIPFFFEYRFIHHVILLIPLK
jgi:hypothetical protein